MTDQETFEDAIQSALDAAKRTGKRYFILAPYIANPGLKDNCFLGVPLIHEESLEADEQESVVLTIFPSGKIAPGLAMVDGAYVYDCPEHGFVCTAIPYMKTCHKCEKPVRPIKPIP